MPVALGLTVPVIVRVTAWPAPAASVAPAKLRLLPDDALVPQLAVPVVAQLTPTLVIEAGTTSVMSTPFAFDGPRLVIVTV